jgi:hypothetical protein
MIDKNGERTISVQLLAPHKKYNFTFDWQGKIRMLELKD